MKEYNITAQVYETSDRYRQTILLNRQVAADSEDGAINRFTNYFLVPHYQLVKIYSIEEISQVAS